MVSAADKMTTSLHDIRYLRRRYNVARNLIASLFVLFFAAITSAQNGATTSLFNGKNLDGWKVTDFGGEGEVRVEDGQIIMRMGQPLTGVTLADGSKLPTDNFEVTLQAMKRKGDDFFCALTFPVRDSHASFVIGGWAGTVV